MLQILKNYLKEKRVNDLYCKVKKEFQERGPVGHDWEHIYRAIIHALWVGEAEKADMNIVIPAIILHDIGFLYDKNPSIHHITGSKNCIKYLDDWNREDREKVSKCILSHKGKIFEFKIEPKSLEEKVVYDADTLDKCGHIGVYYTSKVMIEFVLSGRKEYESIKKVARICSKFEDIKFYTKTAKRLARKKGGIILDKFFKKVSRELELY
jgi:HD superfamily phosphodiesterase